MVPVESRTISMLDAHDSRGNPAGPTPKPRTASKSLRSRAGCETCKRRHVKCDEGRPICDRCSRLHLECLFAPPTRRLTAKEPRLSRNLTTPQQAPCRTSSPSLATEKTHVPDEAAAHAQVRFHLQTPAMLGPDDAPDASYWRYNSQIANEEIVRPVPLLWQEHGVLQMDDPCSDLNLTWAGCELDFRLSMTGDNNCIPPGAGVGVQLQMGELLDSNPGGMTSTSDTMFNSWRPPPGENTTADTRSPEITQLLQQQPLPQQKSPKAGMETLIQGDLESTESSSPALTFTKISKEDEEAHRIFPLFRRISQPPAAVLIGGVRKWRRLQQYLLDVSSQNTAVSNALLCVLELLFLDEISTYQGRTRDSCWKRILDLHETSRNELDATISNSSLFQQASKEHLLVALFLLAWFEVIKDRHGFDMLFPRYLVDQIILSKTSWDRTSGQLLSWMSLLDSKSVHLGGKSLLSDLALEVASRYPTQVMSYNYEDSGDPAQPDGDLRASEAQHMSRSKPASPAPSVAAVARQTRSVQKIVLLTLVQPAIEWYMSIQAFCRKIGSHDPHHRKRGTPEDEYEVVMAYKQLEKELWELWNHRPTIISLEQHELAMSLPMDVVIRLKEIFCVHLAAYWILFVYLHRVTWWNLPHSQTTQMALTRTWHCLQRAYGEVDERGRDKMVHPALLWPLFMFGSECTDETQRLWAIGQLSALGRSKPMLEDQDSDQENLVPFRLSAGATRNARRAALLLKELVKRQDELGHRVDDRDLSMQMFGCYFSIV